MSKALKELKVSALKSNNLELVKELTARGITWGSDGWAILDALLSFYSKNDHKMSYDDGLFLPYEERILGDIKEHFEERTDIEVARDWKYYWDVSVCHVMRQEYPPNIPM